MLITLGPIVHNGGEVYVRVELMENEFWTLARTPAAGMPSDGDFAFATGPAPTPGSGQMLTRTVYISLDPYQWGRRRSGLETVGEVCHARTVSQVVDSNIPEYQPGDFVFNTNGWQRYGLTGDNISVFGYMYPRKIDPTAAPISTAVGVLGMLGLTAYAGLIVQCDPKPGETVVVSAASGGVGQIAGQLARIRGCRVVGIAGAKHKCDYVVDDLRFDACVSHLSDSFADDLRDACPNGVDVYFENVGGNVFAGVLPLLNRQSRITRCGLISQYGNTDGKDPAEEWAKQGASVFEKQAVAAHPLAVRNFVADYQTQCFTEMAQWVRDGEICYREDLWDGLENVPSAFSAMLKGGNFGKTLVRVSPDPTLSEALNRAREAGDIFLSRH
ncbi:MAG: NADP-dependent oxidoreductase [Pseudomonadota bacterium]